MKVIRFFGAVLMGLVLLAGLAALAYTRWTRSVADADRALAEGRLEEALAGYTDAEARFDKYPAIKQLVPGDYGHVMANELWILYRLGKYDELIDRAARAPESAMPHFWAGCAFFEKGKAEQKPEARTGWLSRSEEELRRAVEGEPEDWDAKFDFELVTRLSAELKKQPKTPPTQLMQLLRPQPKPGTKPVKRVG
jgi:tetratricopeptide (TPR) repeat protein